MEQVVKLSLFQNQKGKTIYNLGLFSQQLIFMSDKYTVITERTQRIRWVLLVLGSVILLFGSCVQGCYAEGEGAELSFIESCTA